MSLWIKDCNLICVNISVLGTNELWHLFVNPSVSEMILLVPQIWYFGKLIWSPVLYAFK